MLLPDAAAHWPSRAVPTIAIAFRIGFNSEVIDWEKTRASFEVSLACFSSEVVPQHEGG